MDKTTTIFYIVARKNSERKIFLIEDVGIEEAKQKVMDIVGQRFTLCNYNKVEKVGRPNVILADYMT